MAGIIMNPVQEQVKQPNNYIANTLMGNPYVIINQTGVPKRRSRKSSSEEDVCSRPFKAFYVSWNYEPFDL